VEENDVFSAHGVEGAVTDGLVRLSRFMTYSRAAAERLGALRQEKVERLLTIADEQLVAPKQMSEIIQRKQSVEKLISTRVAQRGKEKALALP
jgi:hypothetical protein